MLQGLFWNGFIENNFLGHQMAEVYKDEIYRPVLSGRKGLTIVDLGANIGVTAMYFVRFARVVYAVEPASEHFEALTRMIMFNNLENIVPIKKAVGIKNGVIKLFKDENNTTQHSTNLIRGNLPSEMVECITLEKLFEDSKIEHCDFMKMDVEGAEAEILGHTSFRKAAPQIDTIVLENHFWGGRNPNQTREALRNNGFKVKVIQQESESEILVAKK